MNPFHFGSRDRLLFGVYHVPSGRPVRSHGVLICPPLGREYMRTHRALRVLAGMLSAAGQHVLRFDYYGTGDSAGSGSEVTIEGCVQDALTAAEELRSLAGVEPISLVGVRAGASVAALGSRRLAGLDALVLWDPVVRGATYLRGLLDRARTATTGGGDVPTADPGSLEVDGFPVSAKQRGELESLDLSTLDETLARSVWIMASDLNGEELNALEERVRDLGVEVGVRKLPDPGVWGDDTRFDTQVLAPEVVREIAGCIG